VLACLRLSAELNIPCVSLYDEMLAHPDWTLFLLDGLHLNDKGQAFVAAKLLKLIREHVPQCSPETLPMHFPSHRAIRLPPM
jgi:lysophospholipase L1-like esterase